MTHIYDDVQRFALDECINTRPSHIIEAIAAYNMLKVGFLDGVSVSGDIAEWETWWCTKVLPATIHNPEMCMQDTFPPGFTVYTWELPPYTSDGLYVATVKRDGQPVDKGGHYFWRPNNKGYRFLTNAITDKLIAEAPAYTCEIDLDYDQSIYDDSEEYLLEEVTDHKPFHLEEAIVVATLMNLPCFGGDTEAWEDWRRLLYRVAEHRDTPMQEMWPLRKHCLVWELPEFANGDMYIAQVWDGAGDIDDSTYYIWSGNEGHHYCIEPVFVRALERLAPKYNYYGQDDE